MFGLHRYEEALVEFQYVVANDPRGAQGIGNLAATFKALGRYDEALPLFEKGLALNPTDAVANFNYATTLLKFGDFSQGFERYEWRWESILALGKRKFEQPLWLGNESVEGRTILLHQEQGLGDAIQFSRYVRLVEALGARVILEVDDNLAQLMRPLVRNGCVVPKYSTLPDFDVHCPLMSLPLAFKTTVETIPCPTAYLAADELKVAAWAARLGASDRARVGLVWSGRKEYVEDRTRSIELSQFPHFDSDACEVVSLQKEVRDADAIELGKRGYRHMGAELQDFSETAALVMNMDVVISVDTSVAHLAAALGKEVWVLLAFDAEWRWLRDRSDTPWYKSVRLFRQKTRNDWESVFNEIQTALAERYS